MNQKKKKSIKSTLSINLEKANNHPRNIKKPNVNASI